MKKISPRCIFLFILWSASLLQAQDPGLKLTPVATYYTDIFNQGGAETAAFDAGTKRLFFTNAATNTLIILNLRNPAAPALLDSISLNPYGGRIASVAVYNGQAAVALGAETPTDNGKVILFDTSGNFQIQYTVGAAPGMVVFSPDGKKILTANEGTPSNDYSIDPEGSVSIIDLATGTVQTAGFGDFNSKEASLRNRGVRIFGANNPTVAKDLEPEFISISPDGTKAYVTLQENNALAIVDIAAARVIDIQALGYKDHMSGSPQLREVLLSDTASLPVLGTPVFKDSLPPVRLGGFSGLYFDASESTDSTYVLYAIPDRGPNDAPVPRSRAIGGGTEPAFNDLRPLLLPDYQARIVRFVYNKNRGSVALDRQILLSRMQNSTMTPITGRTNVIGFDEIPVTYSREGTNYSVADWVDTLNKVNYTELPFDPFGGDMEGIVRDRDGFFWLCDENRPSVYRFSPSGLMSVRYVPRGTSALGLIDLGAGSYGEETLPAVYSKRWANRGFEAIAYDPATHIIYAFLQSPMDNPNDGVRNKTDVIRILGINASNGTPVSEYVYLLENNRDHAPEAAVSRVDKIGDAVYKGNGVFLVLESDDSNPGQDTGKKFVFEINIRTATNLLSDPTLTQLSSKATSTGPADKTLEMMSAGDLAAAGIRPVYKRKMLNLPSLGYFPNDKPEGLALLPNGALAVLNDNDFGTAGNALSSLGIISFGANYALDPSDNDGGINIANHPVLGMYQPDAIASFSHNGKHYYALANEGDARDYTGFSEETRAGAASYRLDTQAFPNGATLKQNANLGRLRVTNASGDLDGDGDFDVMYSFGGRSFSLIDDRGNLIFDSGNDVETIISRNPVFAPFFNANNDTNAASTRDSRSDDKGPEPSALAIGEVEGVRYAFVGLERIGGIMAYALTDPKAPRFAGYFNNRNFLATANSRSAGDLGLEEIVFIPAGSSPNGKALLVTTNAVSGTVTIFSTGEVTSIRGPVQSDLRWAIAPNPTSDLLFSTVADDYQVFNAFGQLVLSVRQTNRIDVSSLPAGTYVLRHTASHTSKIFIKK